MIQSLIILTLVLVTASLLIVGAIRIWPVSTVMVLAGLLLGGSGLGVVALFLAGAAGLVWWGVLSASKSLS